MLLLNYIEEYFFLLLLHHLKFLLEKKFVATVPGSSFGVNGEGFLRISYANKLENLKNFVSLLTEFMNE